VCVSLKSFGTSIQKKLNLTHKLTLKFHIGIAVGRYRAFCVGSSAFGWEVLVTGEPLQDIDSALSQARPGQVVISPKGWKLVKNVVYGSTLRSGYAKIGTGHTHRYKTHTKHFFEFEIVKTATPTNIVRIKTKAINIFL